MKRLLKILSVLTVILFVGLAIHYTVKQKQTLQFKTIELKSKEAQLIELNQKYDEVLKLQTKSETEKQQQLEKIKQLESDRERLQRELQAKANKYLADSQKLNTAALNAPKVSAAGSCNTGNPYKDFIYMKESGCRTTAVNSIGCRGLGQACPGSKLPCGDDFACQDAWFSNYAITRYGSWESAYNFWLSHRWW
jgi:hypothetical protein